MKPPRLHCPICRKVGIRFCLKCYRCFLCCECKNQD